MKFTCEMESDGRMPFLDCTVSRSNNQFITSVHRKSTFTGLGLSFFSTCPFIYKLNGISTLINRAYRVSSSFTDLNKEFSFLVDYFFRNGYPKHLVYKCIQKFIDKISHASQKFDTVAKKEIFVSMPYFGKQSDKLKDEIVSLVGGFYGQIDLKLIFTNKNTIGSQFQFKERLPKGLLSSCIYEFRCAQCASGTYIGSTIRSLHMRIAEHRGRSFRTGKEVQSSKSSIRDHAQACSNSITIDNFRILGQEKFETHLRILESLYILRLKPTLNETQSAHPLKIAC